VLLQLYAVQSVASTTVGIPLEWTISFAFGGLTLFLPMLFFFAKGAVGGKKTVKPNDIGTLADDDDDDDED
jgi:F0F1-type ATP synthase assembly protein I